MADPCVSILRSRRHVCSPLPPLSDLWETNLIDDLCATVFNILKTSWRPWRPWRSLNVLCATLERPMNERQPFGLLCAFNGDLASFVVAQGRHKGLSPCAKGYKRGFCLMCTISVHPSSDHCGNHCASIWRSRQPSSDHGNASAPFELPVVSQQQFWRFRKAQGSCCSSYTETESFGFRQPVGVLIIVMVAQRWHDGRNPV